MNLKLKPFFLFEIIKHGKKKNDHNAPQNKIGIFVVQFRDIIKVHSINTRNKGKWNKYGSYNGKYLHNLIHFIAQGRHVHIH